MIIDSLVKVAFFLFSEWMKDAALYTIGSVLSYNHRNNLEVIAKVLSLPQKNAHLFML